MIKAFILFLVFESAPTLLACITSNLHRVNHAKPPRPFSAKAKQEARPGEDGKKLAAVKLIDATCLEK